MKESYIKLPNITVSKLQDVVDYLDENNIEYIEDYKEEVELNKYKEILDKIKEYIENNKYKKMGGYGDNEDEDIEVCLFEDDIWKLEELLEEIE